MIEPRAVLALVLLCGMAAPALAESPSRRMPRPAEPALRPCPEHGPGFVRQPGSNTCVRISGQVRGETLIRQRRSHLEPQLDLRSEMRVVIDARTSTDFGTVRLVFRLPGGRDLSR